MENKVFNIEENSKIQELEEPVKDGYIFLGWYVGKVLFDFETLIN